MRSPVQEPSPSRIVTCPFSSPSTGDNPRVVSKESSSPGITALSVEFVAKPQVAHKVQSAIPLAIAGALQNVTGFAGCLVMVSNQEARLVTVATLWTGDDRFKRCGDHARWVHKMLTPYVDRCLRVQTLVTNLHVPVKVQQGMGAAREYSALQVLTSEEERFAWRS